MPKIETTVIPTQLSRVFCDYRRTIDEDLSTQTVTNVLFTTCDAAARIWDLANTNEHTWLLLI